MTGGLDLTAARARQSHIFERQAEDWYCEPSWCWQRLFERKGFVRGMTVLDPACGLGTCVEAAKAAGMHALGTDIVPRWEARPDRQGLYEVSDFLKPSFTEGGWPVRQTAGWQFPDAICSNPPFKHAREFADLALRRTAGSVCLLLPTKWIQGADRARWLDKTPLHKVLFICPRPSMPPGHVIVSGQKPGNGTVDFAFYWWLRGYDGAPQVGWLQRDGEAA